MGFKYMEEVQNGDQPPENQPRIHETLLNSINSAWNILLASRCLEFESHCRVSIPPGSSIEVGKLMLRDMALKQWVVFRESIKPKLAQSVGTGRGLHHTKISA
jgi:hypothetical protein